MESRKGCIIQPRRFRMALWILMAAVSVVLSQCQPSLAAIYDVDVDFADMSPEPIYIFTEGGIYAKPNVVFKLPSIPISGVVMNTSGGSNTLAAAMQINRASYIAVEMDLEIPRSMGPNGTVFDIVLVRGDVLAYVGEDDDFGKRHWCCTPEMQQAQADLGKERCNLGSLIVRRAPIPSGIGPMSPPVVYMPLMVPGADPSDTREYSIRRLDRSLFVRVSGVYTLILASCGSTRSDASLRMTGQIIVKNPHGYLAGQLVGFMRSYEILYYCYLSIVIVWIAVLVIQNKYMLTLHLYLSGLLFLGLIEAMLYRHAYHSANLTGTPMFPIPSALLVADFFSVVKIVISKLLILLVSMGWCVVRASVGPSNIRAATVYSGLNFLFALAHEVISSATHKTSMSFVISICVVIPLLILDTLLMFWIFVELSKTRSHLKERRQFAKLRMYRVYTSALVLFLMAISAWGLWAIVTALKSDPNERWHHQHWQSYFLVGGFPPGGIMWDICYFGLLCVMLVLFVPSERTSLYTPSVRADDDEEEPMILSSMEHMDSDSRKAVDVKEFFTLED